MFGRLPLMLFQMAPPLVVRKTWPFALNLFTTAYASWLLAGSTWISFTLPLPAGRSCSVHSRAVIRRNKNLAAAGECAARCRIDRVRIRFRDSDRVDEVSAVSESIAAGIADRCPGVTRVCCLPNSVRPVENAVPVSRVDRERRIEILHVHITRNSGGLGDPGVAAVVGTPEEIRAEAPIWNLVIHAVAIGRTELGEAAIAAVRLQPGCVASV